MYVKSAEPRLNVVRSAAFLSNAGVAQNTSSHRNVRPPPHWAFLGDWFIWQKGWPRQVGVMVLGEASQKRTI
jgi:hypothetical protein